MLYGNVFKALNKARVKYVVAGGVAVVLHGYTRYTTDLDLIVYVEDKNLDKLFDSLCRIGYQPKLPVKKEEFLDKEKRQKWVKEKNMIVFSFYHKKDSLKIVDIFIKEPMSFKTLTQERVRVKLEGVTIPLISIDHLRALKKKSGRPQDITDIVQLDAIKKLRKK